MNMNTFDDDQHIRKCKRMNKCNSWLTNYPNENNLTFNQIPIFINSSMNAMSTNEQSNVERFPSALMLIHKKRLSTDNFLSKMQHCIQPPYSQNHFYAFDQFNMLKLQRILRDRTNLKRKYSESFHENEFDYSSPDIRISSQKQTPSPLRTADHISINKYHEDRTNSDEKTESQMILLRLEKILNLCEELRTLATDVESHLNEKPMDSIESEQAIIEIYNDNTEIVVLPTNGDVSIQSNENKSEQIMQTESFKTKSTSQTTMRKPEDICECFLKAIFDKEKCPLSIDEQEYLEQLTKAYRLGRAQVLKEQDEANDKFQAFINENLPEEITTSILHTNNNHQSIIPIDSSLNMISDQIQNNTEQQLSIECGNITIKHQIFITEPIGSKSTNILPGIGIKYAQQLANCGFLTVRRLLGFYLLIKNEQNFVQWLMYKPQLSTYSAWLCTKALRAWCQIHL